MTHANILLLALRFVTTFHVRVNVTSDDEERTPISSTNYDTALGTSVSISMPGSKYECARSKMTKLTTGDGYLIEIICRTDEDTYFSTMALCYSGRPDEGFASMRLAESGRFVNFFIACETRSPGVPL